MAVRAQVRGSMLAWARERAGLDVADLLHKFPKLLEWESGTAAPTLKQLEEFANTTHTAVGYLFLPEPPVIELPLPDYRTRGNLAVRHPSPDLLDTIFQTQQRQEWYENYALTTGSESLSFVGSLTVDQHPGAAADTMRLALNFDVGNRGSTWSDAFRVLADHAEELGVLVMVNGVVGSNTHRKLNPNEFQGFALASRYAPVVFVNGVDTRAAQTFTLAHELAHIWLGQTGLDDPDPGASADQLNERWCSDVAAEMLVPLQDVARRRSTNTDLTAELDQLARIYKVSTLVILRRLRDAGDVPHADYWTAYRAEVDRLRAITPAGTRAGGGNFYNTQPVRTSKRLARAIIANTLEGQTLYRDAFQMLGFKKLSTFHELARQLGVT